jgi:hypothetical protein
MVCRYFDGLFDGHSESIAQNPGEIEREGRKEDFDGGPLRGRRQVP